MLLHSLRSCASRPLLARPFSRLPLPTSLPPSALRPLVAFSPLNPPPTSAFRFPSNVRSIPLAATGQSARVVQEGGPLEQGGTELWILPSGTLVGWGLDSAQLKELSRKLLGRQQGAVGARGAVTGEEEKLDFYVDRSSQAPRLEGDIVVLPSVSIATPPRTPDTLADTPVAADASQDETQLLIRYAISDALSHSSQLSIVEAQLDSLLSKDVNVPSFLAKHGRGPYSRKQVIQRLGEFLEVRQSVSSKGLGEVDDLYWEEPLLEKYLKSTWKILEIRRRVVDVNERIAQAQEVNGILKDLLTEQSTHNMEIIIILLIAVEVTLAFWTHWEELCAAVGFSASSPRLKSPSTTEEGVVI